MKGKSFLGLIKPRIVYPPTAKAASDFRSMPAPNRATFLIGGKFGASGDSPLKVGDTVKSGQKLTASADSSGYAIASIAGTVSDISPFSGNMGREFTAVTVDASGTEAADDSWESAAAEPSLDTAAAYLDSLPGAPALSRFLSPDSEFHTVVILGADQDLIVGTQQQVLTDRAEELKSGIRILKKITGIDQILLVVPRDRIQGYGSLGAVVKAVDQTYPSAFPRLIMKDILETVVPVGQTEADMGVAFISAEAVASIGAAYDTKRLPSKKYVTFIRKDGSRALVEAHLGTPVRDILAKIGEDLNEKDRLILGGPMTGSAIHTELYPVSPDTDAIMVQDRGNIAMISDYPCINCGDCVRVCPVNIPINLLVRFLEANAYEDAAMLYDLHSCVDCGLCSYVCVSRIPIFQYIRLAKHELKRTQAAEATND